MLSRTKSYLTDKGRVLAFLAATIVLTGIAVYQLAWHPGLRSNLGSYFGASVVPLLGLILAVVVLRMIWKKSHLMALLLGMAFAAALSVLMVRVAGRVSSASLLLVVVLAAYAVCIYGVLAEYFWPNAVYNWWAGRKARLAKQKAKAAKAAAEQAQTSQSDQSGQTEEFEAPAENNVRQLPPVPAPAPRPGRHAVS